MWIQGLVWRDEGNVPTNKKRNGWLVGLDGWKAWRNGENSMDCGTCSDAMIVRMGSIGDG